MYMHGTQVAEQPIRGPAALVTDHDSRFTITPITETYANFLCVVTAHYLSSIV